VRLDESLLRQYSVAGELEDFTYVFATEAGTRDTIHEVSYQMYSYQVDCNTCILGDGSSTVIDYKDFQYQYKGRLYNGNDTLSIGR
jgi:hypothetical protein